jgi:hypothetical protein
MKNNPIEKPAYLSLGFKRIKRVTVLFTKKKEEGIEERYTSRKQWFSDLHTKAKHSRSEALG